MSTKPSYSFLPWMRQGLAGQISTADGDATVDTRAGVAVNLELAAVTPIGPSIPAEPIDRTVQLYGPGDITGIDARSIVRTDPRDWITDAEPNYLAQIEFYDEDLPWRYTPAAPDASGLRLRPWISLIVLEETEQDPPEFRDVGRAPDQPLPAIEVDAGLLPPAAELWAWAHVHVNASLSASDAELVSTDVAAVASRLEAALGVDRDIAYSRLVCPRRLRANARYHAFVVPTFETGRLAGLGLDPAGAPFASASAWGTGIVRLPHYHRWYFRTGEQGDFEYLVRLLQARTLDARVGVRDVDTREPGSNVSGYPDLGGILKLGGALRVPDEALRLPDTPLEESPAYIERQRFENWDQSPPAAAPYPQPIQRDLAAFVNLPDDYAVRPADEVNADSGLGPAVEGDPDPLITAPLYGRWHALTQRLLVDRAGAPFDPDDNWVHELNLDPRHRLAAGFGTRVVQDNQERYMDAAWNQIGDVLEANRRIRLAQLAKLVSQEWWSTQFSIGAGTTSERVLRLTAPAHRHILVADSAVRAPADPDQGALPAGVVAPADHPSGAATLRHRFAGSVAGPTVVSTALRRVTRPGGRMTRMLPYGGSITPGTLLERMDAGAVAAAPPRVTPPGLVTTDELADAAPVPSLPGWVPKGLAEWLIRLVRRLRWLPTLLLVVAVVLALAAVALFVLGGAAAVTIAVVLVVLAAIGVVLGLALGRVSAALERADLLRPDALTAEVVDALPPAPGFVITEPGQTPPPAGTGPDSPTAARFKDALRDWHNVKQATDVSGVVPPRTRFRRAGLERLAAGATAAIQPAVTVPRRLRAGITLPPRIVADLEEDFGEVMAYPRIDQPMYEPLRDRSSELLLPNLNLIPPNTISLLETNQPFIEAYMVGLNHEMARELLWREYPTDQRGTPFRQFWDVSGARPEPGLTGEAAAESLRDIPELHRWPRPSRLGQHDNREPSPGVEEAELVLVIRGELLKKYPNAIIYAHKAWWDSPDHTTPAPDKERILAELTPAQEADPPPELVLTPLYEARVSPDLTFFGFDLTDTVAKGAPDGDAGWFFCIKQREGEPRFGFDIEGEAKIETVNDIAWSHLGTAEGGSIAASALSTITLDALEPDDTEKVEQRADDARVVTAAVSAARWAYLAYQSPVLVAVHAAEMLEQKAAP
jgi:hypothetical protein